MRRTLTCALLAASACFAHATLFLVDSTNPYLMANGETPFMSVPINLNANGFFAGQTVLLTRVGSFNRFGGAVPTDYGMSAVFSTSSALLPPGVLNRVPGAVSCGPTWVSPVTAVGGLSTDISEDFRVCKPSGAANGITVVVPTGATFIFASAIDDFFSDNNNTREFYLSIQTVPEPGSLAVLTLGVLALRRRKVR